MLKKFCIALGFGLFWLFVFSIPIGRNKHVFNLAWFYIVDTTPINWIIGTVSGGISATTNSAKETADEIVGKVDHKLDHAQTARDNIE